MCYYSVNIARIRAKNQYFPSKIQNGALAHDLLAQAWPAAYNLFVRFFHYHAGTVSRSTGRSCVQAVAYITRSALFESRRGIHVNYTYIKNCEVFWETLSPEGSGIDKKDLSIWDKIDLTEDDILTSRYKDPELREKKINSARTAYDDEFSLPKELTREQNIELVREYVNTKFISKNLIATYAIHWEEGNPHVHIVYSARPYIDREISKCKSVSRDLRGPAGVRGLREVAAQIINKHQEMAGLEDRVDPRSYAERGHDLIPTKHKGYKAHRLERDGHYSRIAQENERIIEENKQRIVEFPSIILKELTATRATFSESDAIRVIQDHLKDDMGILGEHVFHAVLSKAVKVGKNIFDQERYTTQEYFDREAKVLESLEKISQEKAYIKIDPSKVEKELAKLEEQGQKSGFKPNEGQINAIKTLCGDAQLCVLVGRAGTGKTTTLKPVVQLHQEAGYKVWGMAPSATAATQLEADTGCKSDTIAHYAYYWKKYEDALKLLHQATTNEEMEKAQADIDKYMAHLPTYNSLLLIDEAGMIPVGDSRGEIPDVWDAIMKVAQSTGPKLIFTGDDHQNKPVGAGDVCRKLVYDMRGQASFCELTEIKRQNIPWMQEASRHLSELNVATALALYENNGHLQSYSSNGDVYKAMAQQYLRNMIREPDSKGIVIAATNEERKALNQEIRSILKENDLLPKEDALHLGTEGFCVGDKIIFTKNDRGWNTSFISEKEGLYVQNGMQAVIQSITPYVVVDPEAEKRETFEIVVYVPDHKATVQFTVDQFKEFTHSYAVTGHKSQGATLVWSLVKLSKYMDAYALYVYLTRHQNDVSIYYSNEDFKDYNALVSALSKANVKDLVVDYSVSDENMDYWQNVQEYKEMGRELVGIRVLANSLNPENKQEREAAWEEYRGVEADRKSMAQHILADWEVHKDFARQAKLTRESLEIAAGLKKRALSRVELQAQLTVEQYVTTALETRQLWRDIRKTHPGIRAKSHPEWGRYEKARDYRGSLANQICLNPILHRAFLKEVAENLAKADIGYVTKDQKVSYSMATIKAQAETHQSKMLQTQLLREGTNPVEKCMLETLIAYTENRDMAASIWKDVKPKLDELKGTLLKGSCAKDLAEHGDACKRRDFSAMQIMEKADEFMELAERVGIKLNLDKLKEQAIQGKRDKLLATYKHSPEKMTQLQAAHELNLMMKDESNLDQKFTVYSIYKEGLTPKDIANATLEYQKHKVFEGLKTEEERGLFLLLDDYNDKCQKANQIYVKCMNDVKDREGLRPWHSAHYEEYKAACHDRNAYALEIFDQRDHGQVLTMAEKMGIRFKDVDLEEVFSRCEQANRTRHITAYLKGETLESKGEAAVAIRQMIAFEKREKDAPSKTAQQAFYAGIDFKELQTTVFEYGRACVLKSLSSEKESQIYHALEHYENAFRPANRTYKACIDESREKAIKPWETEKFKEYIALVTVQDETAHELIKKYDASSVIQIAQQMGISVKKLDVESHRHSLRRTLQTFMGGDRTNVPMAAQELLNWLEFDRHGDHKHTFKILREQDIWPKAIEESLNEFFRKKRGLRHESERETKRVARTQNHQCDKSPEYRTVIYERRLSFSEIDEQLRERMLDLSMHLIGKPTSKTSKQLRFGRKGSVCVFTSGPKQGLYANHETGVYGGPLKLIEEQAGLTSAKEAYDWAIDWLKGKALVVEHKIVEQAPKVKQSDWTWTPITPVPMGLGNPDIEGNKYLNFKLESGAKADARYVYRDEAGNLLGYVVRIIKSDGSKETVPLAYCHGKNSVSGKEFNAWKWRGFFTKEKTPYGLEKLKQNPDKPILIVEGEKTCDAAQKLFPEYHVLGWIGGAGSVGKTNWQCLIGKDVVIWPDYDYNNGGQRAGEKLWQIVTKLNEGAGIEGRVGIVALPPLTTDRPPLLPDKWDLADKLPDGWTLETVSEMVKEAVPLKDKAMILPQEAINIAHPSDNGKVYTPQEQEILKYLQQEIPSDEHTWLRASLSEKLLHLAEQNPYKALEEWQDISNDYSFKPSIPDELLTQEQRELKENILSYLQEEVGDDKYVLANQQYKESLFEVAKKEPLKALQQWQKDSKDYHFNPLKETLTDREICVQKYVQDKLIEKSGILSPKAYMDISSSLLDKPLEAYQRWQLYTNDQKFDPATGVPKIEQAASDLMTKAQKHVSPDIYQVWQDNLTHAPEKIIKECTAILDVHDKEHNLTLAAKQFISLSKTYAQLSPDSPTRKRISEELKGITDTYIKDENFIKKIENSRNSEASQILAQEIQTRQRPMSRDVGREI